MTTTLTPDQFADWRKYTPFLSLLRESLSQPTLVPGGYIDVFERAHRDDMNDGQVANSIIAQFTNWDDADEDEDAHTPIWESFMREQIAEAVRLNREHPEP